MYIGIGIEILSTIPKLQSVIEIIWDHGKDK